MSNGSLAEQLAPLQRRAQRSAVAISPVLQVDLELAGGDLDAAADEARRATLAWMQNRAGRLPRQAWEGGSFEHMPGGPAAFAARLVEAEIDCWLARLDDPDHNVPQRTWITEIAVVRYGAAGRFAMRQQVATRGSAPDFCPMVPGIVRQVVEKPGLQWRGRSISARPRLVAQEDHVKETIDFIRDRRRRRPLIIASLDEGETDFTTCAIDAVSVAYRSVGLAHVVVITGPMTFRLSDWWGKEYSVFRRAVRVYQPGFNPYEQTPYAHPLYFASTIDSWQVDRAEPFEDELMRLVAAESVRRTGAARDLPSYQQVKQATLRQRRAATQVQDSARPDVVRLLEQELEAKSRETEELLALAADAEDERDQMKSSLEAAKQDAYWLRYRVDELQAQLEALGKDVDQDVPIPDTYDGLADWAAKYLAGRLLLHPRASRAAKNADFGEPQLAYRALLLLANEYRSVKLGAGEQAAMRLNERLRDLGLHCTPTGERSALLQEGDEFVVRYHGRKSLLDWHLKNGGNTREPRRCFRCYFFWDPEDSVVVVGSLPGHLTTRST